MRPLVLTNLLILVALAVSGCSSGPDRELDQELEMNARPSIKEIIDRRGQDFLAIEGVVIVFEGATTAGDPCIKIGVVNLTSELSESLPKTLEGWPVVVFESGVIEPMDGR